MAQQATLQQALQGVTNPSHAKQLQTVYESIMASLAQQPQGRRTGLEALVACAEVALKVGSGRRRGQPSPGPRTALAGQLHRKQRGAPFRTCTCLASRAARVQPVGRP